jgi:hypothetical protein
MGESEGAQPNHDGEYDVFHFESPRDLRFGRPAVTETALWQQTFSYFCGDSKGSSLLGNQPHIRHPPSAASLI